MAASGITWSSPIKVPPAAPSPRPTGSTTPEHTNWVWSNPAEAPLAPPSPQPSGSKAPGQQNTRWHTQCQVSKTLAAEFEGRSVEHRDVHEITGLLSTLTRVVVGATVFPDAVNTGTDQHRVILQSSDGSSRLMEVGAFSHLPEVTPPAEPTHVKTSLWRAEQPHEKHLRPLVCAPDHVKMVEEYSKMLVAALQHRNMTHDENSFECNPVTGAVVCAAAGPVSDPEPTHPRDTDRQRAAPGSSS